jgi:hypothetical protein
MFTATGLSLPDFDKILSMDSLSVDEAYAHGEARSQLFSWLEESCKRAYKGTDPQSLYTTQYILFKIYQLHVSIAPPGVKTPESSTVVLGIRNLIESYFEEYEASLIPARLLDQAPRTSSEYVLWLIEHIHNHPAYKHPLYEDYLSKRATLDDLREFLNQEMTIDSRFDDFLALTQLGAKDRMKLEIASNYWDEMGNGDRAKMHTNMFSRTLESLGVNVELGGFTTEALICGNISFMLSLRRSSFYKAVGYFVVTEYLAPGRFQHVITACERNGLDSMVAEYHREHVTIDRDHSRSWFDNVVIPLIDESPQAAVEISLGAFYRLNTSQRYLNKLSRRFNFHPVA